MPGANATSGLRQAIGPRRLWHRPGLAGEGQLPIGDDRCVCSAIQRAISSCDRSPAAICSTMGPSLLASGPCHGWPFMRRNNTSKRGGETGLDLLAEAVKTLERSQSPLELARTLSDYGAALRRAGRRVQARAELERALDLAHYLGARRIANQAREELTAAGAKPRRDAITGRDALTAGELRVARLAAEGLTNREIAQALFITTKTAKAHLSHVYRKLEITRRSQLANALTGFLNDDGEDPSATATIS